MEKNLHRSSSFHNLYKQYNKLSPSQCAVDPSIFVFIQLCLATSLWVSTALLDYEQLTVTHSLDHHQDHHVPV
jgi:hypothetical protein